MHVCRLLGEENMHVPALAPGFACPLWPCSAVTIVVICFPHMSVAYRGMYDTNKCVPRKNSCFKEMETKKAIDAFEPAHATHSRQTS
ncbi:hypothetical protein BD310DRAFT_335008 [Dichomitus squalens]|uniref:Uncharacterized protein n=1 Tax=Dichomitus squalens TaxID=114155 RepID=A0A4Q9PA41_9APHY|nr:hypothetical protein BD310DRAFT_335008 [Dichomitus squalens]